MHWFGSHIAAWFAVPLLAFSAWFGFHGGASTTQPVVSGPIACTQEAKECPDGSYVGRTGPNCAFAACPVSPAASTPPVTRTPPTPTPVSAITIYNMTPTSGPTGTHVVIDGFGFTNDNTIHFGSGAIVHVPITSSIAIACTTNPSCKGGIHQTIEFDVPSTLNPACYYSEPRCLIASRETTPGDYQVSVQNSNGTSSSITFTVTSTSTNDPVIESITPTSGPVGTTVTLGGNGFTADNIIHFGGGAVAHVAASPAVFNCPMQPVGSTGGCGAYSQMLTFTVPQSVGPYCPPGAMCPMYLQLITPGAYTVYVENSNGTSNKVTFAVTSGGGDTQPFSITGLDAPVTLALGESGTWTVHASVPDTVGQLHYSATWGDEANAAAQIMAPAPQQIQTSASFTHAYQRSGTYTATFTVSDDSGHSAQTSTTVTVTPLY